MKRTLQLLAPVLVGAAVSLIILSVGARAAWNHDTVDLVGAGVAWAVLVVANAWIAWNDERQKQRAYDEVARSRAARPAMAQAVGVPSYALNHEVTLVDVVAVSDPNMLLQCRHVLTVPVSDSPAHMSARADFMKAPRVPCPLCRATATAK